MTQPTQQGHADVPPIPAGLAAGMVIADRFRIDRLIGAGGMGIVAAATHLELGHRVAIKFLRDELAGNAALVERFIREARAVVGLRTEHVCRVLDVARLPSGAPFIVMEMLDGADLAHAIASQPLHATVAVEYVLQACIALAEAHAAGVIHRDLKPANLFVTRRIDGGPLVKVLDFGIAKAIVDGDPGLTRTRVLLGSPSYMSPEQIDSPRGVDPRSDVWSLGVTLYELLSRRLPFRGASQTELAVAIAISEPAPLDVDPRLRAVVLRCLEKSRDARFATMAALAAELAPFGGPRGRMIATQVAQVSSIGTSGAMSVVAAPPPVARDAATAVTGWGASSVVAASTAASVVVPLLPPTPVPVPVPVPRRRRWPWLLAPLVGLGGLTVAWLALRGSPESRPEVVAPVVAVVAPADAAPVDAAPVDAAPVDVAVVDAAAPDAPDAPADAGVASKPGKPHVVKHAPPAMPQINYAALMSQYRAQMAKGCREVLKPEHADLLAPAMVLMCACQLRDQSAASKAFAKLSVARENFRTACASLGVTLQ